MKGIFVVIDGCGDESCQALGMKTPLEYSKTPNLDAISKKSKIGLCYTVRQGVVPESDNAIVSLLGYDSIFEGRGPLEALGQGINLKNGDLAFRCNFATIDSLESGNVLDRRAGRTLSTSEARLLAKSINEKIKLPYKFEFYPGVQHRGVLVIRGGFSDNISKVDVLKDKLEFAKPDDEEDDSKLSSELVNSFVRQSFAILDKHPVNISRVRKGLFSANIILCRGVGNKPAKFKKLKGNWLASVYMPLEKGIAKASGMEIYSFRYPRLRGYDSYANLYAGLKKAIRYSIKMLKRKKNKYDYFFIHFKETDLPGHDNKPLDKVKMIELIDSRFFSFLKKFIGHARLVVVPDHATACRAKSHTADAVPILIYPDKGNESNRFTEECGAKGDIWKGKDVLSEALFIKKN